MTSKHLYILCWVHATGTGYVEGCSHLDELLAAGLLVDISNQITSRDNHTAVRCSKMGKEHVANLLKVGIKT